MVVGNARRNRKPENKLERSAPVTSPERRKGAGWEREIVSFLSQHGFPWAERAYGGGRPDDRGDVDAIPGMVLEAKNHKTLALAEWCDQAAAAAAGGPWAVIHKRRNKPTAQAYVTMTLEQFARIMADEDTHAPVA
jgi:hypothetical protein